MNVDQIVGWTIVAVIFFLFGFLIMRSILWNLRDEKKRREKKKNDEGEKMRDLNPSFFLQKSSSEFLLKLAALRQEFLAEKKRVAAAERQLQQLKNSVPSGDTPEGELKRREHLAAVEAAKKAAESAFPGGELPYRENCLIEAVRSAERREIAFQGRLLLATFKEGGWEGSPRREERRIVVIEEQVFLCQLAHEGQQEKVGQKPITYIKYGREQNGLLPIFGEEVAWKPPRVCWVTDDLAQYSKEELEWLKTNA